MMRRCFIVILAFLTLALSGLAGASFAQNLPVPADQQTSNIPLEEIPDEYIDESLAFFDHCSGDHKLTKYYNCECLAAAYLDERIAKGPSVPASGIELAIGDKCRDTIGAAGPAYNDCLKKANRFPPGTDPEVYCECVANTYVKLMDRAAPDINSRSMVHYQTQSYVACRDPDLARKLFPYVPK